MTKFILLARPSIYTYGFLNTLIARGCIPRAVILEGKEVRKWPLRLLEYVEKAFLWLEHQILFRGHPTVTAWKRYGDLEELCFDHGIPVYYEKHNASDYLVKFFKSISKEPLCLVLCGCGIIKPHILSLVKGTLNGHSSLLPKFKGARAEERILKEDPSAAGVSIHWVDEGIDTGKVIVQEAIPVKEDTAKTLRQKAYFVKAHLMADVLRELSPQHENPPSIIATLLSPKIEVSERE